MRIPIYEADKAREYADDGDKEAELTIVTKAVKKIEQDMLSSSAMGFKSCHPVVELGSINKTDDEIREIVYSITASMEDAGYKVYLSQIDKIGEHVLGYYDVKWY